MKRWFITVDWCNKGNRGIFCRKDGNTFGSEIQHTEDQMWDILGSFYLILAPKSEEFTEDDVKQYTRFIPFAEYCNEYGIAIKGGN